MGMIPTSTPAPKAATRGFVVGVSVAMAAAVTAAVIGFSLWKDGHLPSIDGLSTKVVDSMNESLSQDEQYRKVGLRVKEATVLRVVGNMFEGQATAATATGSDHSVGVHITYDGESLYWHTDSGSFAFVVQEQFGH
jgi:hypothetical protein